MMKKYRNVVLVRAVVLLATLYLTGCSPYGAILLGVDGAGEVDFYGRVVDQYGDPVVGARIGSLTGGSGLNPGQGQGFIHTDEDGRFEIHTTGTKLQLNGIMHPDVVFHFPETWGQPRYGSRITSMTFYKGPPQQGRVVPLLSDTSRDNPYLFRAWRVEQWPNVFRNEVTVYTPIDGSVYTLVLDERDRLSRLKRFAGDGHLRVSCERAPMEAYSDRGDWKVTIAPVDGGIQETDDFYMVLAPETGYQPAATIEMNVDSADFQDSVVHKRYYFTARNGQVYGSLFVNYLPFSKTDRCQVDIAEYTINTEGARNLAYQRR